jgi:hypothetical protein
MTLVLAYSGTVLGGFDVWATHVYQQSARIPVLYTRQSNTILGDRNITGAHRFGVSVCTWSIEAALEFRRELENLRTVSKLAIRSIVGAEPVIKQGPVSLARSHCRNTCINLQAQYARGVSQAALEFREET